MDVFHKTDEKDKSIKIADPDSDHKSDDTKDGKMDIKIIYSYLTTAK